METFYTPAAGLEAGVMMIVGVFLIVVGWGVFTLALVTITGFFTSSSSSSSESESSTWTDTFLIAGAV